MVLLLKLNVGRVLRGRYKDDEMRNYKIELTLNDEEDLNNYYNTILTIAEGYGINITESKCCPIVEEEIQDSFPEPMSKIHLDINEAAEFLNLSKATLYKYTSECTIPYYKLGNRILFNKIEIEEWLEGHKVNGI